MNPPLDQTSPTETTAAGPPRLVVTDLDGTFLSPDGTVSATNAAAVRAAQRAGVPVVFATGRPIRWLDVIAGLPGAHPTVIASNGAVLYDLAERRVLDTLPIAADLVARATTEIRAAVPDSSFGFESGDRFGYEQGYLAGRDVPFSDAMFTGSLAELMAAGPYVKILVRHTDLDSDKLAAAITAALGGRLTVTHSSAALGLVEISAPGVSKASMLERCCHTLGIGAADVAAFGDMPNDVDMLSWVGRPHVVANAHPLLLATAATVVGTNADSGVGRTILGWFGVGMDEDRGEEDPGYANGVDETAPRRLA
ncbi:MAG: HAD hydrolase family protein [Propionibacteriaceae bacterium]